MQMKEKLRLDPLEKTKNHAYFVGMVKITIFVAWAVLIAAVSSSFAQRARTTTSTNMVTTTTNRTTKVISPP